MKLLQDRIAKDGKVLPGNIIKVDGFLNHRVDVSLLKDLADEFYRIFSEDKPTLIINEPHKYLQELLIKAGLYWTPWTKFVKRNFLTDNGITFYEILSGISITKI